MPIPRSTATLTFIDKSGKTHHGVNIGRIYDGRRYVEFGTESKAVFKLSGVTAGDLLHTKLVIDVGVDVFRIFHVDDEANPTQLILRNPRTKLTTQPMVFDAQSFETKRFQIPRKLLAKTSNSEDRTVDLLDDLVEDGEIELILRGDTKGV